MLILEANFDQHDDRLAHIEEAIFNVAQNGEETLFEKMGKKIKQHEIYMKTELKRQSDRAEEKYKEFEERLFSQD